MYRRNGFLVTPMPIVRFADYDDDQRAGVADAFERVRSETEIDAAARFKFYRWTWAPIEVRDEIPWLMTRRHAFRCLAERLQHEIEGTDIDYLPVLDQQGNGVMKDAYDDNCESGVLHIMRARRANGRAYVNPAWIPTWLDLGWRPA